MQNLDSKVLQALIKIQNSIYSKQFSLAELLNLICYHAMTLTDANGAVVEFITDGIIEYRATAGSCDSFRGLKFPAPNSLSYLCLTEKKAMLCADTETDDRVNREQCRKIGVASMAVVPLLTDEKEIGVLKVISSNKNGFNDQSSKALTVISAFLATAIQQAEVAEEKQAALAFAEEQLRFRESITTLAPNNIYIFDLAIRSYVYTNNSFQEFLGQSLQEIQKKGKEFFRASIHPDDLQTLNSYLGQFEKGNQAQSVEYEMRAKNAQGLWRWLRVRESVFKKDDQGKISQIIGIATDITSLRDQNIELENRVAMRNTQLNSLTEKIPQLVWQTDANGKGIYVNSKWIEYTGKPLGADFNQMIHPDDLEECMKMWGEALATKQDYKMEYRLQSKAGDYRWFLVRGVPTLGTSKEVVEWFGTCTDIHDQKTAQEAIQKAHVNEQAAQEASKLKSEFLANMSHEIRTPLNGVIGVTGLLTQTALDGKQREYVDIIRSSGQLLLTLINDILDFSKIEAGKLEFEQIDFSLVDAIQDVKKTLSFLAFKKGLRLQTDFAADLPAWVSGDPGRLKQVLFNLVNNAIKFTAEGTVTVKCTTVGQTNSHSRLRVEVQDTGIGISKEARAKMFRAFSQADASTHRKFGGTGLGLSICKNLVERMNGDIGVESEENQGSTFWFEVDLGLVTDPKQVTALEVNQTSAPKSSGHLRILIAEDNSVNQLITSTMLENLGFESVIAENGVEVLKQLEENHFDLILMDCHMPEMDGYEATRRLRSHRDPRISGIKIIAMTANAMAGDAEKCLAAGMDDYLSKPVSIDDLSNRLEYWLNLQNPQAALKTVD